MAAGLNTLAARVILIGLAIHAVLLPLLFYGLLYIVQQSHEEGFVNDVRKYSRFLADVFEFEGVVSNKMRTVRLLDSAILGSDGVYAELIEGDTLLRSGLSPGDSVAVYEEDFAFGRHGDHIYFLSLALDIPGRHLVLRMGFDELPTIEQVRFARQRLALVLFLYLIVSIIALVLLSTRMTRPLRALQNASRNIAEGQYSDHLQVDSQLTEIRELATDLESMRSELVGMNASLTQEIAEREAVDKRREVLESKLRQVHKLETVGVLAGGIAHEFNNILVPIFLYAEQALYDLPAESPVRAHLERVLKSSNRAKSLVQQILTFSRQSGPQAFEPVDVRPIVEEALDLLRALIPSTVELQQDLAAADDCMVLADRNQIHQLVMNLCSNAYQALDETGGSIAVVLDRCAVDEQFCRNHPHLRVGRYVRLSIHDTGHGIDRSNLHRIFEPFYTTRAVGQGTGLGLSVVHGIAVSHSGDITVESEPGQGTTFHVYLPEMAQPRHAVLDHDQQAPASR
jgi:signal transduction histidine kinase